MIRTLVVVAAVSLFPLSASANQIEDSIVSQLRSQGFTKIEMSRTFLGRARVTATSPTLDREIIYNPVTGAILRDYWTDRNNGRIGVTLVDPNTPASHGKDENDGGGNDSSDDGGNDGADSGDDGADSGDDGADSGDGGGGHDSGDDGGGGSGEDGGDDGEGDSSGGAGGDDGGDGGEGDSGGDGDGGDDGND